MDRSKVYIETAIVSLLAARPSRDLLVAAHQSVTVEWWEERRHLFGLFCSEFVIAEAQAGDPTVASKRLALLEGVDLLDVTPRVHDLARKYIKMAGVPPSEPVDALHIAVATVHGMDYLLTWNCSHIANAELEPSLRIVAEAEGYSLPVICTPEGLMGEDSDEERPDR